MAIEGDFRLVTSMYEAGDNASEDAVVPFRHREVSVFHDLQVSRSYLLRFQTRVQCPKIERSQTPFLDPSHSGLLQHFVHGIVSKFMDIKW